MKRLLYILFVLPLLVFASSCIKDAPLTFDHEAPAFEAREGLMLLEIIVPKSTLEDDVLYIAGEFNGGAEAAASNPLWQFERSSSVSGKWGLYIDPSDFENGKSLSDGYQIISTLQGEEYAINHQAVIRTEAPELGGKLEFYLKNWKAFFDPPQAAEHTGSYVIYIEDNTGWDEIALYTWGESPNYEAFGSWPGMTPTGTEKINGRTYIYFDVPEDAAGTQANIIFNNNNNGSQVEGLALTINRNLLIRVSAEEMEELELKGEYYFWITNQNPDWTKMALYSWGDINDVLGPWPGAQPTGKTITVRGLTYQQFVMAPEMIGTSCNLIANNNDNGQQCGDVNITPEEHDYYFMVNADKTMVEVDPRTVELAPAEDPDDPSKSQYFIYVQNLLGWDPLNVHIYTESLTFTEWPGVAPKKKITLNDMTLSQFAVPVEAEGKEISLIFNNGAGAQTEPITVDFSKDVYISLSSTISEFAPDLESQYSIYVQKPEEWEEITLYCWGDAEIFGGWPGALPVDEKTIDGITYSRFVYPASKEGLSVNLIFNNNDGGSQTLDVAVVTDQNHYFTISGDTVTPVTPMSSYHIYLKDLSGWSETFLYSWGGEPNYEAFGSWPGALPEDEYVIGDERYKRFELPYDAEGRELNLIFNNNNGGSESGSYKVTFTSDIFVELSASIVVTALDTPECNIYVENQSSWTEVALYIWGDVEALGGWPGALPEETVTIDGKDYLRFALPAEAFGKYCNLILNNNNGGSQSDAASLRIFHDIYLLLTDDIASLYE